MQEIPFLTGTVILDKSRKYLQVSEEELYRIQTFDFDKVQVGETISGLIFQYRAEMKAHIGCDGYVYPGTIKKQVKEQTHEDRN
jgi:hypothetical protein